MRKLLVLVPVLALAACGGKSSSSNNGPVPLTGTVGGRAFTNPDVRAIPAGTGSTACDIPGLPVAIGIKGFALQFTSYSNGCGDYTGTSCTLHRSAQSVTVLYARLNGTGTGTEPALLPGTYAIHSNPAIPTQELSNGLPTGYAWVTYATELATDASCGGTPVVVQSGTLRIDQVTGPITGHISAKFSDTDSLEGDFSAALCAGSGPNVCEIAQSAAPNPLCPTTTCP